MFPKTETSQAQAPKTETPVSQSPVTAPSLQHVSRVAAPEAPEAVATQPSGRSQPDAPDRLLVRVPIGRLIGSVLAGVGTIVLAIVGLVLLFDHRRSSPWASRCSGDTTLRRSHQ